MLSYFPKREAQNLIVEIALLHHTFKRIYKLHINCKDVTKVKLHFFLQRVCTSFVEFSFCRFLTSETIFPVKNFIFMLLQISKIGNYLKLLIVDPIPSSAFRHNAQQQQQWESSDTSDEILFWMFVTFFLLSFQLLLNTSSPSNLTFCWLPMPRKQRSKIESLLFTSSASLFVQPIHNSLNY